MQVVWTKYSVFYVLCCAAVVRCSGVRLRCRTKLLAGEVDDKTAKSFSSVKLCVNAVLYAVCGGW